MIQPATTEGGGSRLLSCSHKYERKATHAPSFSNYLNKGFALRAHAQQMADARTDPEISPASVFLALFHAFTFRLPSFQQLDSELAHTYLQQWIGAGRAFRDDTLRYSLCSFDWQPLEAMLVDVNRRLRRDKAFDEGRVQGHLVAALDGIEVLSSYSRRCEHCLERMVISKDQAGRKQPQTQYYHRAVGCQMIHSPVKPFLAIEWLRPGESEDAAALRLLTRLPDLYGSRFFDILLLDALYTKTPVLQLIQKMGWHGVISLKRNTPELFQSALGLFARRPPDQTFTEKRGYKTYRVQVWDTEGLPFTIDNPEPVRVVRSEEVLERNRYRQGELTPHSTDHEWMWVTTLDQQVFPAVLVRQLGHGRWKNENNGWMDLTKHWAFKHGFLHACRHRPKQVNASGEREPVSNHGLAAVTLILLIAFALSSAFVLRHSKLARRDHLTTVAVAAQLHASVSKAADNPWSGLISGQFWPTTQICFGTSIDQKLWPLGGLVSTSPPVAMLGHPMPAHPQKTAAQAMRISSVSFRKPKALLYRHPALRPQAGVRSSWVNQPDS